MSRLNATVQVKWTELGRFLYFYGEYSHPIPVQVDPEEIRRRRYNQLIRVEVNLTDLGQSLGSYRRNNNPQWKQLDSDSFEEYDEPTRAYYVKPTAVGRFLYNGIFQPLDLQMNQGGLKNLLSFSRRFNELELAQTDPVFFGGLLNSYAVTFSMEVKLNELGRILL